ncbi:hypothetical protein [Actinoallomurus iriomotensis]|uniref:Uncharacterized protein n=1 Tax=Actinoallomurus iriomotensis TaxID=478107 RepID=A0A9W6VLN7_9ACTN|nr:hypothetical protein [Actinoallomurus iriomotensis]GLY72860.1 hypothetical protein Airi01_011270 [Actinoallomurus iriomotensis]
MNEEREDVRTGPPERTGLTAQRYETEEVRAKAADALQIALDRRDNGAPRNDLAEDPGHPDS